VIANPGSPAVGNFALALRQAPLPHLLQRVDAQAPTSQADVIGKNASAAGIDPIASK
jgi:hypothetical protein